MGAEQLTGVLDIIMREAAERAKMPINEEMAAARKAMLHATVEQESDVYYTSSRLIDDGVIDPRDTRTILGLCLSAIYSNQVEGGNLCGVSRM